LTFSSISSHRRETWLLETPEPAHRLDQVVHRARRYPVDVGFLDDRGQRLLGQSARLQERREVAPRAKLGDAQLHRPGARLPISVAIAVALSEPVGRARAMRSAGLGANLELHQSLSRKADHLAQNIRVGGLLHKRAKVHHLVGHWGSSVALRFATRPYRRIANDRRKPLARYGAIEGALRERLAPALLHQGVGHDRLERPAPNGLAYRFQRLRACRREE